MPPYRETPYNANVIELFTCNIEEVNKKRKEAKKSTGVFVVDSDVCG
jgi:hypothetical protein